MHTRAPFPITGDGKYLLTATLCLPCYLYSHSVLLCLTSSALQCSRHTPPPPPSTTWPTRPDCFRGSSSARLLWLVNVCLFIAYLNVSHAVYLLFVLRCAWNCSINRVNRVCCRRVSLSPPSLFCLDGLKLMEHKAPNMEGFSYHRVDWWPAAVPTARWCYWGWRHEATWRAHSALRQARDWRRQETVAHPSN